MGCIHGRRNKSRQKHEPDLVKAVTTKHLEFRRLLGVEQAASKKLAK
jgi:hypothetical protein